MYTVQPTPFFENAKNKLKKKYPHIEDDYSSLVQNLKKGEFPGAEIQGVTGQVFKVRVASIDQRKGKSGGFRVIYYVVTEDNIVYLLFIYAKAKRENIKPNEIQDFLNTMQ